MPEVVDKLLEEHRNISRLLRALERQLAIFDSTARPDYDVLTAIAEYFTSFPDRCHHPKEDLVFRKLCERAPERTERMVDLEAEHEKIAALALQFQEAVQNVLDEVELPRSVFHDALREFIDKQRKHLEMEEEYFFPVALEFLTPEDWDEIDAKVSKEGDPLFGTEVTEQFEALRDDILAWEREART